MATTHDSLKEKYLQQAHQLITKPSEKPRANVEPFVHSVQPRHSTHPHKDHHHHMTPLSHTHSHHGNSTPHPLTHHGDKLTSDTGHPHSELHSEVVRTLPPNHTPQLVLGETRVATQFVDTSPEKRGFPYPTTSTPITRHTHHTPTPPTSHTPTRLFSPPPGHTLSGSSCQSCLHFEQKVKFLTEANRELKRLLVASLGNNLKLQLEQLIHEKAAMSCDLDVSLRQLADNMELVDKVSIDCDIWRSKFYASRLMIDELATVKREVSQHLADSQRALERLLEERNTLNELLQECTRMLETNTRQLVPAHTPVPTNGTVVDLAQRTQQLIQLYCDHTHSLGGHQSAGGHTHSLEPTKGERMARQVLSSQDREVLLPLKLKESDISRQQWVSRSHDLVGMSHDLVLGGAVDFHCVGCKGPLLCV